jgi:aerobic C4-dicarboxylate transport protein
VATVVVGKWTGELDMERMRQHLDHETPIEAENPEAALEEVHMPDTKRAA